MSKLRDASREYLGVPEPFDASNLEDQIGLLLVSVVELRSEVKKLWNVVGSAPKAPDLSSRLESIESALRDLASEGSKRVQNLIEEKIQ